MIREFAGYFLMAGTAVNLQKLWDTNIIRNILLYQDENVTFLTK